jgi:hypothetical protein
MRRSTGPYSNMYRWAEKSKWIDPEHLWTLVPSCLIAIVFVFQLTSVISIVSQLFGIIPEAIHELALSGLIAGIASDRIYYTGERRFAAGRNGPYRNKEDAFMILIASMIVLGGLATYVVPGLINSLPYPSIQIVGLVIVLGFYYLHRLVSRWSLKKEWPHVVSAILLTGVPFY